MLAWNWPGLSEGRIDPRSPASRTELRDLAHQAPGQSRTRANNQDDASDPDADDVPGRPVHAGVRAGRCLGLGPHRLIWATPPTAEVVARTLMAGDASAACCSPRRPTATSATTPAAASPIGMV